MSEDPGNSPSEDTSEKEGLGRQRSVSSADSDTDEYLKDVAVFVKDVRHDVIYGEVDEDLHWSDIGQ